MALFVIKKTLFYQKASKMDISRNLRESFQVAARFFEQEVNIKQDLLDFLNRNPNKNWRVIEFEKELLLELELTLDFYNMVVEIGKVKREFEHLTLFDLTPEHIERPQGMNYGDFNLLKKILGYCLIHDSCVCGCNDVLPVR